MGEGFKKPIEKPASASLDALAQVWDDQTPPFSPDAYANLTAAELRLITAVAGELGEEKPSKSGLKNGLVDTPLPFRDPAEEMDEPPSTIYSEPPAISRGINNSPNSISADVAVEVMPQVESDLPTLFDLRARYSRTLFRASIQLRYHTTGRAMIGNYPLVNLLHSMRNAAVQELLNPGTCLSTHHPQDDDMRSPVFVINVVGTGITHYLSQDVIGDQDGLLAGLVNILGNSSVQSVPEIEIAASRTLLAIAPKLIEQWLVQSTSRQRRRANGRMDPVLRERLERWHLTPMHWDLGLETSSTDLPTDPSRLATSVLNQLFLISSFALSALKTGNLHELLEFTWSALYSRANMSTSSRAAAHTVAISYHGDILALMIDSANQKEATALWSLSAKKRLAQFLGIIDPSQDPKVTVFRHMLTRTHSMSMAKSHILAIMKLLQSTPEIPDAVSILLAEINRDVLKGTSYFYDCFTRTSLGFTGLSEIGKNQPEYAPIVAKTIIQLIITLEKWYKFNDSRRLTAPAVSGFLDAVQFVCRNKPPEWNQTSTDFFRAFINTIKNLGFISHELFYSHDVVNDIKAGLRDLEGESRRRGLLFVLDKLEKGHKRQAKTLIPVFFSKYKHQGVPKSSKFLSSAGDTIGAQAANRIWIDSLDPSSDRNHIKDYYDGLAHSCYAMAVTNSYLHNHWKVSLIGQSDNNGSEGLAMQVTYAFNKWSALESHTPSFRFGHGHIYSNSGFLYSGNGVKQPLHSTDSGYANVNAQDFGGVNNAVITSAFNPAPHTLNGRQKCDTGTWNAVGYSYTLLNASAVPDYINKNAGALLSF